MWVVLFKGKLKGPRCSLEEHLMVPGSGFELPSVDNNQPEPSKPDKTNHNNGVTARRIYSCLDPAQS